MQMSVHVETVKAGLQGAYLDAESIR